MPEFAVPSTEKGQANMVVSGHLPCSLRESITPMQEPWRKRTGSTCPSAIGCVLPGRSLEWNERVTRKSAKANHAICMTDLPTDSPDGRPRWMLFQCLQNGGRNSRVISGDDEHSPSWACLGRLRSSPAIAKYANGIVDQPDQSRHWIKATASLGRLLDIPRDSVAEGTRPGWVAAPVPDRVCVSRKLACVKDPPDRAPSSRRG